MRMHAANTRLPAPQGSSASRTSRFSAKPLPAAPVPRGRPSPLPSLTAAALAAVESLIWTLRTGHPYLNDHQQLAASLRRGDLAGAVEARNRIPWIQELELAQGGIGGMMVHEHRHPRVRKASEATQRAFSRLKVYLRHGVVPKG